MNRLRGRGRRVAEQGVAFRQQRAAPHLARVVSQYARSQGSDQLFVPLTSPASISTAAILVERGEWPITMVVWDPPEYYLASAHGVHVRFMLPLLRAFERALRGAKRYGVMSERMRDEYGRRFGVEGVVIRHGISSELCVPPAATRPEDGEIVIAFAGSLFAKQEWQALLDALACVDWMVDGRPVRVRLYGAYLGSLSATTPMRVEFRGWLPTERVVAELARANLCYLPYWFDEWHRVAAQLCFPTKLSTYVAAGTPILYHGPADSSPTQFLEKYPVGVGCHSLESERILESLRIALSPAIRRRAAAAILRAFNEELDARIFRERFATLIGTSASDLQPVPAA
jgi:hypothetical protein